MAGDSRVNKPSLLSQYNMPITHLSYEHVAACHDVKALERIVKILRSGEEGLFPELQRAAEDRLRTLSPASKYLREEVPALTQHALPKQDWDAHWKDLTSWTNEMAGRDAKLMEEPAASSDSPVAVRNAITSNVTGQEKGGGDCTNTKSVCDYAAWDKYDVETELLKMDLEEERKTEFKLQNKTEPNTSNGITEDVRKLSVTEKLVMAEQMNTRGNEHFRAKDFRRALRCYTDSIVIRPSAKAHNNRAACYLNLCRYSAALEDADAALALEPRNSKALYRRGVALRHNNSKDASQDFEQSLKIQADNRRVQETARDIQHLAKRQNVLTHFGVRAPIPIKTCRCDGKPHSWSYLKCPSTSRGPSSSYDNSLPTRLKIIEVGNEADD